MNRATMEENMERDTEIVTRKAVIRHLSRNKQNEDDPQTPTMMGLVEAFVMGIVLAVTHGFQAFARIVSSPQPRATRTASILQLAVSLFHSKGDGLKQLVPVETANGLNDFSSDPRFEPLKKPFKAVKGATDIESEQAIFLAGGAIEELRGTKLIEAFTVIDGIDMNGDTLVTLHGATIDGLYAYYAKWLDQEAKPGMLAFGRMIGKCEGFILSYDKTGTLVGITKVERPAWLNALAALIGGGGD